MSELIVVAYPDVYRAAEVIAALRRLQTEYLVDLEDAVYVTKDPNGKVKLHQSVDLTTAGALEGGFWGALIGLIFFAPILGGVIGASAGALAGSASDYGIDDDFIRELSAQLAPGSSAIFVLVRKMTTDKVIPELSKFGGTLIRTSLPHDVEERIQAALSQGSSPGAEPPIPEEPAST